ncbi:hypothetical protein DXG01_003528 [Tephrocybe rancida]|nr:hypothetical protein DXG01_003528 [Tephrocybe rancida]
MPRTELEFQQKILLDDAGLTEGASNYAFVSSLKYIGRSAVILSGDFTVNFTGTSLSLFGELTQRPNPGFYYVVVDGGVRVKISSSGALRGVAAGQSYTSPALADSAHSITFLDFPKSTIDYATVDIGTNTPLLGNALIVDDKDPSISYVGQWSDNTGRLSSNIVGSRFPVGGSMMESNTNQSSATFHFSGA